MKFLEKGIYKIFGAVILVSMIGALVAEPIAMGDVWTVAGYYLSKNNPGWSPEASLAWDLTGIYLSTVYGAAVGMAVGGPAGAAAGAAISL